MITTHTLKMIFYSYIKLKEQSVIELTSIKSFHDENNLHQFAETVKINSEGVNIKSYSSRQK